MSTASIITAGARRKSRQVKFLTVSSVVTVVLISLNLITSARIAVELENNMEKGRVIDLPTGADQHNAASLKANITNTNAPHERSNVIWMYWTQGLDHLISLGNQTGKYQLDSACVRGMMYLHRSSKSNLVVKLLDNTNVADYAPIFSSMVNNKSLPVIQNRLWSDLLRLELLSLHGGIWADTSVCPFVPFDKFISKYLGSGKESFYAPEVSGALSHIEGNALPKNVSTCHLCKNDAVEYRTASTWLMAVSNPHNPLIEEWLRILIHHLTTLPNPNEPYYISHCSLTQARMYNTTVDSIWRSSIQFKRNHTHRAGSGDICFDSGSLTLDELKMRCALVKKPNSHDVKSFIMGEYLKEIRGEAE
ncbi:hypothetical protein HJC23_007031 [Cyclotella cryptica]|uniref:Uncharacterized protein n=1 Tax=Cyclotella cryptica TaxID=29204 RepID=A0ABD3QND7_9STRA|eukprot:CCRYP_004360-RA/>CCRYP_004360-RA protein AED:0.19 eAED:0.19 QI:0/-1/0/1/-1/1/1/0/362